jgi:hypothetical protein
MNYVCRVCAIFWSVRARHVIITFVGQLNNYYNLPIGKTQEEFFFK